MNSIIKKIIYSLSLTCFSLFIQPSYACDDFAGRILTNKIAPVIEDLDCSVIKRAGIDKKHHHLDSICYQSNGPESTITGSATLNCKTSGRAMFKASVSENVDFIIKVKGSDCSMQQAETHPHGALGQLVQQWMGVKGGPIPGRCGGVKPGQCSPAA